jgi:hypothetical protein
MLSAWLPTSRLILNCLQKRQSADFGINRWTFLLGLVVVATMISSSLVWFTKAFNLEWLLNLP